MQTGIPECAHCRGQGDYCPSCGGSLGRAVSGAASLRGARWAELVVRTLVLRWPERWPRSPKAFMKAAHWVDDLAGNNAELRRYLIDVCLAAAGRRYDEMVGYLAGRRLQLPPGPTREDGDDLPR